MWDGLWEEEDNIVFDCDIPCVIFAKILWTRFSKKKDDESEGDSELTRKDDASELSSHDRVVSDTIEAEVVEDNDLVDDEHRVGDYWETLIKK